MQIVFMQDCFHADCLHARLFPGKIVFMQDCLDARLFSCRLSSCKIISMQDCFHAGFHVTCRGISVHFRGNGTRIRARRLQNRPRRLQNRPRRLPKSTPDRPRRQNLPKFSACSKKSQEFSCILIWGCPKGLFWGKKLRLFHQKSVPREVRERKLRFFGNRVPV